MVTCALALASRLAALALVAIVMLSSRSVAAQSADTAAALGTVVDVQGALLPGVTLTATNVDTGVTRSDVTSKEGTYRFRAFPPGRYELSAQLPGFQTNRRTGVILTVGAEATINFTLQVAGVVEAVTVEANAPIVNTTTATTGANLDTKQLELLPTLSRDFPDFLRVSSATTPPAHG